MTDMELKENNYTVDYILKNNIDKKAYGFIYITTNLINNKKYIGKRKFYTGWKGYLGSGIILKKSIKKYGKENFKKIIIDILDSKEELNKKEKYWIKFYNAVKNDTFYNVSFGGDGAGDGKNNFMYGKHFKHSEETKIKIGNANKGHLVSNEAKKIISLHHANVSGKNNPMYGKHRSEELKKKLSDAMKMKCGKNAYWYGKHLTKNAKQKISKANSKCVIQLDIKNNFIKKWDSMIDVTRTININSDSIGKVCNNKYKSAGGFKWMYYEDYLKLHNKVN